MRVVFLSDIHGNFAALQAVVREVDALRPDAVLVGGDVINRGPQPRECLEAILERIQHHDWRVIRGNHEDYVLRVARGMGDLADWEWHVIAHTTWTYGLVKDYLPVFAAWPDETSIKAPDGSEIVCTHASRKGNRVGLYNSMTDEELIDHAHLHANVTCVGHTHIPFKRQIHRRWFVNAGAVGMPFDGDHRASFALLDWTGDAWKIEIRRVDYDRESTRTAYHTTGYLADGGPMVPIILWELEHAKARLGFWHQKYEKLVTARQISLEESIRLVLNEPA